MVLWGTIVNAAAIVIGGALGLLLPGLNERMRTTVMQGIGLAVCVQGIMMAVKSEQFLIPIASLVLGGITGELLNAELRLQRFGLWLERMVGRGRAGSGEGRMATGFVTTTLIYCVGAMAILGSLDSGLRHNHDILYAKAMMDGFLSVVFASALGAGVMLTAVPILLYQGGIAVAASMIAKAANPALLSGTITEVAATGGLLVIGVGLNILDIRKIHVANLLPAVLFAAIITPLAIRLAG